MEVKINDEVKIKSRGMVRSGKVISSSYYPQIMDEKDFGWQIEFLDKNNNYGHWKQWADGGELLEVNGKIYNPKKRKV